MYRVTLAQQVGDKAGRGHNKTSSVRVQEGVGRILKRWKFFVDDPVSKVKALKKARDWVKHNS